MNAGWIVSKDVAKTIEVRSTTGDTATVDLRRFTEGDRMDRENVLMESRTKKGARDQSVSYKIGLLRLFDLKRAIVSWSLPFPVSDSVLRDLEPAVASQLHDAIRELNPFIFDDGEEIETGEDPTEPDAETT